MPLDERLLYPIVQDYFEEQGLQCWIEREIRKVPKPDMIPDLAAKDSLTLIAVEIEGDATSRKIQHAIGQVKLFQTFANKVYLGILGPIPDKMIQNLHQTCPEVGLLEIMVSNKRELDPERLTGSVRELFPSTENKPTDMAQWTKWFRALDAVKELQAGREREEDEKRTFWRGNPKIIREILCDDDSKTIRIKIDDPAEDLTPEALQAICKDIEDQVAEQGLREKYGPDTSIHFEPDTFNLCPNCDSVMCGLCYQCGFR
jgi:hypothetical protein